MHTHAFSQITDMQDECRGESPSTSRAIILAHFPQLSMNFVKRHLAQLLTLSPGDLVQLIGYPDPTGEQAVRTILAQMEVEA